jgi:hypothetical protein
MKTISYPPRIALCDSCSVHHSPFFLFLCVSAGLGRVPSVVLDTTRMKRIGGMY